MANSGRMAADEFIRRFLLHALSDRFIASAIMSSSPTAAVPTSSRRQLLAVAGTTPPGNDEGQQPECASNLCPGCGGHMEPIGLVPRWWPAKWHDTS
jgi:hypothetical protein